MSFFYNFIHRAGFPFIGLTILLCGLSFLYAPGIFPLSVVLAAWCIYFFRNPARHPLDQPGVMVSPADGKIVMIQTMVPPSEVHLPAVPHQRISIFLNIFDVHVNRIPLAGRVKSIHYIPGKFFNASLDKASAFNERNAMVVETPYGDIGFTQIAGLIARRIMCDATEGQTVTTGQVYGIIRFGSRMDVYIPTHIPLMVRQGQRTIAGETILAILTPQP